MSINERIAKAKGVPYLPSLDLANGRNYQGREAHALELIDELVSEGAYVCIESPTSGLADSLKKMGGDKWRCSIEMPDERMIACDADTMCEAVCEAWLEVRDG